ncbi:MAG: hypothetical protein V1908_00745 [Candidatus Peregrinibacteria bacterium]
MFKEALKSTARMLAIGAALVGGCDTPQVEACMDHKRGEVRVALVAEGDELPISSVTVAGRDADDKKQFVSRPYNGEADFSHAEKNGRSYIARVRLSKVDLVAVESGGGAAVIDGKDIRPCLGN